MLSSEAGIAASRQARGLFSACFCTDGITNMAWFVRQLWLRTRELLERKDGRLVTAACMPTASWSAQPSLVLDLLIKSLGLPLLAGSHENSCVGLRSL